MGLLTDSVSKLQNAVDKDIRRKTFALLGRGPTRHLNSIGVGNNLWFVTRAIDPKFFMKVRQLMVDVSPPDNDPDDFNDWEDTDAVDSDDGDLISYDEID